MAVFTWTKAMRRCNKCSRDVPNSSKGWSMHPFYKMICPACTEQQRKAKNAGA
jgi:hypothetical protein